MLILCTACIISACDSRGSDDKPIMSATISDSVLYTDGVQDTARITVNLTGNNLQIANQIINCEYNHSVGTLVTNTGNTNTLKTNSNGSVTALFLASNAGSSYIQLSMKSFFSVNHSFLIRALHPSVLSIASNKDTVAANGVDYATITVQTVPAKAHVKVSFESNNGSTLENDNVYTNSQGIATNTIISTSTGLATVKAYFYKYPTEFKSLGILFQ